MLKINSLKFGYDKKRSNSFSDFIEKGSLIFVIGPNGSGKTSLLKTLAGTLEPLDGSVDFKNQKLRNGLNSKERPAFLPAQNFADENLIGQDIFDLYVPGESSWAGEELMTAFNVQSLLGLPLRQLSTGEQKRIYLAATLSHPSDFVILDEPLNFLDWGLEFSAVEIILKQLKMGRAFLVSVHNLSWCLRFERSQTWVLNKCARVKTGPTAEVLVSSEVGEIFNFRSKISDNPIDGTKILVTAPK